MNRRRLLIVVSLALGLSLTAQIAPAHVGRKVKLKSAQITAMNDSGAGTAFSVRLVVYNNTSHRRNIGCGYYIERKVDPYIPANGLGNQIVPKMSRATMNTIATNPNIPIPGPPSDYKVVMQHCHAAPLSLSPLSRRVLP